MSQTSDQTLLNVRRYGSGPAIVLVHGVVGSGIIWHKVVDRLKDDYELICVDLLGYGYSPKPWTTYDVATHNQALHRTISNLELENYQIMGLSMGAILALDYADKYGEEVERVTLVGLPYFQNAAQARQALSNNFWCKLTINWTWLAGLFVGTAWALGRRISWVRQLIGSDVYSPQVVKESMLARYHSFASSLIECMVNYRLAPVLDRLERDVDLIQGSQDSWTPIERVEQLAIDYPNIRLYTVDSIDHNIAVLAPDNVVEVIKAQANSSQNSLGV